MDAPDAPAFWGPIWSSFLMAKRWHNSDPHGACGWHATPLQRRLFFGWTFQWEDMMDIWVWVKTLVPLVNIKIAGTWMFIPPNIARLVLIHPHIMILWTMVKSWYMREILQKTCRFTMFYHGFYQKPSTTSLGRGPWNCASSEVLDPGAWPFPHEDIATHKPF